MSDSEEQESILNNLSKTRQLWSSKADLGTANYLIPKSPISPSVNSKKQEVVNGNSSAPIEVVRPDDQEVENYELPDIKAMKSQWEVSDGTPAAVPLPISKSPAALAREKSQKEKINHPVPEPVNRGDEAADDDVYQVELNKLKAQFESAARAASKPRPKSPKTPMQNSSIKGHVTRNSTDKQPAAGNTNKKIRFEDEMTSSNERYATEQRAESENLSVNLSGIKTQFENRRDENLVTPQLSFKRTQDKTSFNRISKVNAKTQPSNQDDTSSQGDVEARDEPIKSSEPIYDQMTGDESVKDRLKRFNSITESKENQSPFVPKRTSLKREAAPTVKQEVECDGNKAVPELDIVRSPPAGTRETPDYFGSVDLSQTKALFESTASKPPRRSSSNTQSPISSPPRAGRSSVSSNSELSRSSSRHSTVSSRSKSPAVVNTSSNPEPVEINMADIVKPAPAGTKETPDYVPSVKVSSMKNMFEGSDTSSTTSSSSAPVPRRQQNKDGWVKPSNDEVAQESNDEKFVPEVIRPPSAGTKEKPEYELSSDFLKSRAAIFNEPAPKGYTPRNKFKEQEDNTPREIVNAQSDKPDTDYELSNSLQNTKKMFENGTPVSPPRPVTQKQSSTSPPVGEVVRPPPAGTRESDIVPASDLRSAKSLFEGGMKTNEASDRKQPIDIRTEAAQAQQREKEIAAEKLAVSASKNDEEVVTKQDVVDMKELEEINTAPETPEPEQNNATPEPEQNEVEMESEQTPLEAVPCKTNDVVPDEEEASESESDSEAEYVIKKDEPIQIEEEPAGIVPVRVAVTDLANGDADEQVNTQKTDDATEDVVEVDSLDGEEPSLKETSPNDVTQEEAGTSSSDDDFDRPLFKYEHEDNSSKNPVPSGSLLVGFDQNDLLGSTTPGTNTELNGGDQLLFNMDSGLGDTPLVNSSLVENKPKSDVDLKTNEFDLLNGFGVSKPVDSSPLTLQNNNADPFGMFGAVEQAPKSQSDPFDLFGVGSAPVSTDPQNNSTKDPFDLFN